LLNYLFLSTAYIPHGHCYLWQSGLVWLHVSADFLIAIAYFSIPITLFYFIRQQQADNPFEKILVLFSLFIFSCGTTHLISIWTLWHANYWLSGTIKTITALISVYTAIELISFFPFALSLTDPEDLKQANQYLAAQIESRTKIESELEQEKSFLKAVLNSLSVCVVACDKEGVLTLFNRASQETFGTLQPLAAEDWSQHYRLYELDGKTSLKDENLPLSRAYAGETFTNAEFISMDEESQIRIMQANGCPILNSEGKTVGAVVTATNITQGRETEQKLRSLNAELLLSNQELEKFAYVASHDLREPLRMVTSFTQLLAQRYGNQLDEEADKIIGFAVDGAKRMETLIEDLLLYSRIGKNTKPLKIVNCNSVWEKVRANLHLLIEDTEAIIKVKPLPQIVGDESQLVQLFQNLVVNALVYRSNSELEITISAKAYDTGWIFSVEDNGIGIDPKNAQRIFEIFQRLHPKEKYSGTGIGLAICKKIVERHGGDIWVESELGEGSIFRFTLNHHRLDSM